MKTKTIRAMITEVIDATQKHQAVITKALRKKSRISKGNLQDMTLGMDISISKLEYALKEVEAIRRSLKEIVRGNICS